ncbi:MAG: hypothetical protein B6D64_13415 [Bacteroidetes bacterium 4484_276]|nr:MAG: hypothetical protein B6D64_13415 [Bacteroidetes bacterium 4484_276]OYT13956.1 MAG: hypothetical protein B6I19_02510 [Bacteroidetes bacterium 4572_114]
MKKVLVILIAIGLIGCNQPKKNNCVDTINYVEIENRYIVHVIEHYIKEYLQNDIGIIYLKTIDSKFKNHLKLSHTVHEYYLDESGLKTKFLKISEILLFSNT